MSGGAVDGRVGAGERLGYRPELDGLRAFAVLGVIGFHFWGATPLLGRRFSWSPTLGGGYLGVDLFFLLSGFLITRLLIEEHHDNGRISPAAFYARRAARLLPAIYLMLILLTAYVVISPEREWSEISLGVFTGATYSANWMIAIHRDLGPLSHLWTLSVEEQFYFVWPLIVIALGANVRKIRGVSAVVVVVAALDMLVRSLLGESVNYIYYGLDNRCALSLVSGGLMAAVLSVRRDLTWGRQARLATCAAIAVVAVLVSYGGTHEAFMERGGFVIAVAAMVLVVVGAMRWPTLRRLVSQPVLVWIGRRSYGLYLWHQVVYAFLRDVTGTRLSGSVYNVVCVACTVAIAEASYQLLEQPVRRWAAPRIRQLKPKVVVAAAV